MIDELILRTRDCSRLAAILSESERRWVGMLESVMLELARGARGSRT